MTRASLGTLAVALVILSTDRLGAQVAAPPRVGSQQSDQNADLRPNNFEPNKPVAMPNDIIKPIPLSVDAQRDAISSIDKQISEQVQLVGEKLKTILPDELNILSKTDGWKSEDQQRLVVALRANDGTAVYEAWTKGNPQDTAGAELAARQTDAKRIMGRLVQDVDKDKAAVRQNVADLDTALNKISTSTPAVSDVAPLVKALKTWVEARHLIEHAEPQKGGAAKLPVGDVTLVFDPTLPVGTAIVLNNKAMLIGNEGVGPLSISTGNAAKALKLPIVTRTPIPEAQGEEILVGSLIENPKSSKVTINYNINGNHYVMEPGMVQKLPADRKWVVEFDRGQPYGAAAYTLQPGTFHFTPSDLGLQFYRHRFDVVLDNTQSNQEFNFLFQGEALSVPAGGTRKLSSLYPIVVKFDRGNGDQFVTKTLPANGNVQVGVYSTDNLWDLFPTTENRREAKNVKPFNTEATGKR